MELRRYVLFTLCIGPGLPQQDSAGYAGGDPRQQNARRAAGGRYVPKLPVPHTAGSTSVCSAAPQTSSTVGKPATGAEAAISLRAGHKLTVL